jgi:hypothetical protein
VSVGVSVGVGVSCASATPLHSITATHPTSHRVVIIGSPLLAAMPQKRQR